MEARKKSALKEFDGKYKKILGKYEAMLGDAATNVAEYLTGKSKGKSQKAAEHDNVRKETPKYAATNDSST